MNKNRIGLSILLLVIIAIGVLIFPHISSLYNQIYAGNLINRALTEAGIDPSRSIPCIADPHRDSSYRLFLEQAIENLTLSTTKSAKANHSNMLLGRAYCYLGNPNAAVEAYELYLGARPNDPIAHLELGFAYEKAFCQAESNDRRSSELIGVGSPDVSLCTDPQVEQRILSEWRQANLVIGSFLEYADANFANGDFINANRWYRRAAAYGWDEISFSPLFKWSVSAAGSGYGLPEPAQEQIEVQEISSNSLIEGESLRWMMDNSDYDLHYGDQIATMSEGNRTFGVMWWAGQAVTFIKVKDPGIYKITITAQNFPNGRIKLRFERDFVTIDQLNYLKSDGSWEEVQVATRLTDGLHVLGLTYLEDQGDAKIDSIRLERVE